MQEAKIQDKNYDLATIIQSIGQYFERKDFSMPTLNIQEKNTDIHSSLLNVLAGVDKSLQGILGIKNQSNTNNDFNILSNLALSKTPLDLTIDAPIFDKNNKESWSFEGIDSKLENIFSSAFSKLSDTLVQMPIVQDQYNNSHQYDSYLDASKQNFLDIDTMTNQPIMQSQHSVINDNLSQTSVQNALNVSAINVYTSASSSEEIAHSLINSLEEEMNANLVLSANTGVRVKG